ncbi:MAG: 5-formyltetrahydrofolate cyclo-ligase [Gammaproteobacteria bacterium]|nr:5-formyltetrahydrofolate cyclo-ligase [Gammaproteobacteria bacterium]
MKTQKQWREEKRQARKNLSTTDKAEKSQTIIKKIIESNDYKNAKHIGMYLAMPEEVNLQTLIETAWKDGKSVYLPVVIGWGELLLFAPYTSDSQLVKDALNIDIPNTDTDSYITADKLDLVITPLVAFDKNNNRIGMGGGFYDRTFSCKKLQANPDSPQNKPTLIGVAFAIQQTDSLIPVNEWDIPVDKIISE